MFCECGTLAICTLTVALFTFPLPISAMVPDQATAGDQHRFVSVWDFCWRCCYMNDQVRVHYTKWCVICVWLVWDCGLHWSH